MTTADLEHKAYGRRKVNIKMDLAEATESLEKCNPLAEKCFKLFQTIAYTSATIVVVAFLLTFGNYNDEMYTVETDYLKWVTRVPAITVCPAVSGRFIAKQLSRYCTKPGAINPQNVSFVMNLLRPGKTFCPGCPVQWPPGLPSGNLTQLRDLLTPPCESQLLECSWNKSPFTCCQYFYPLTTRHGICYSLNSDQTLHGDAGQQPFDMVTSFLRPEAELEITSRQAFSLHIHDRKAVSLRKPRFLIPIGQKGEVRYKFTETMSLDSARQLKPSQRHCALDDEYTLAGFNHYSYSACRLQCLANKQMNICGCRHHMLPDDGEACSTAGLLCLDNHSQILTKLKCKCRRGCTGQEVQFVHFNSSRILQKNNSASAVVKLSKPPTERVIYYAQTTWIEIIVGFACLTRLITNATLYESLLMFWRMITNYESAIRLFNHKYIKLVVQLKRD